MQIESTNTHTHILCLSIRHLHIKLHHFEGLCWIVQLDFMESSEYLRSSIQLNRIEFCLCFIHITTQVKDFSANRSEMFLYFRVNHLYKYIYLNVSVSVWEYVFVLFFFLLLFCSKAHLFQWAISTPIQIHWCCLSKTESTFISVNFSRIFFSFSFRRFRCCLDSVDFKPLWWIKL